MEGTIEKNEIKTACKGRTPTPFGEPDEIEPPPSMRGEANPRAIQVADALKGDISTGEEKTVCTVCGTEK